MADSVSQLLGPLRPSAAAVGLWAKRRLAVDTNGPGLDQALAQMPIQEFDLQVEELLNLLDVDLRKSALLRMMDYKNREIADLLECNERKVERKLEKIRIVWQSERASN